MNAIASLGCNVLRGLNKTGKLSVDTDGWYLDMVLGAFDVPNSVGTIYPLSSAKQFFDEKHPLMRKSRKGVLYGEEGHPEWVKAMTKDEYLFRLLEINNDRISHAIRNLRLQEIHDPIANKKIMAVLGDIMPVRAHGVHLKKELDTPDINVSFSLRSICRDQITPSLTRLKHITKLVTYDWVTEGGIIHAHKYSSPGLEAHQDMDEYIQLIEAFEKDIQFIKPDVDTHLKKYEGVGLESANELRSSIKDIFAELPVPGTGHSIAVPAARWFRR